MKPAMSETNRTGDKDFVMQQLKQNMLAEIVQFGYLGTGLRYPYLYPYPYPFFGYKNYVPSTHPGTFFPETKYPVPTHTRTHPGIPGYLGTFFRSLTPKIINSST